MGSTQWLRDISDAQWFHAISTPYLVVDEDLRIGAVNAAYERATGQPSDALVGEQMFDAFPDNPDDPTADGVANLSRSFDIVFSTATPHWMGVQRYDVPDRDDPGTFVPKAWVPVNAPIRDGDRTVGVLHRVEDVTAVALHGASIEIREGANRLAQEFPVLPYNAVLGLLVKSHAVVEAAAGAPDARRAEELAAIRLELLARGPERVSNVWLDWSEPAGTLIRIEGPFDLAGQVELRRLVASVSPLEPSRLIIDLSRVQAFDDDGVAALLLARRTTAAADVPLVLRDPSPTVQHVLERGLRHVWFIIERTHD